MLFAADESSVSAALGDFTKTVLRMEKLHLLLLCPGHSLGAGRLC